MSSAVLGNTAGVSDSGNDFRTLPFKVDLIIYKLEKLDAAIVDIRNELSINVNELRNDISTSINVTKELEAAAATKFTRLEIVNMGLHRKLDGVVVAVDGLKARLASSSTTEHTNLRSRAIPLINPVTKERITFEPQTEITSAAVEIEATSENNSKNLKILGQLQQKQQPPFPQGYDIERIEAISGKTTIESTAEKDNHKLWCSYDEFMAEYEESRSLPVVSSQTGGLGARSINHDLQHITGKQQQQQKQHPPFQQADAALKKTNEPAVATTVSKTEKQQQQPTFHQAATALNDVKRIEGSDDKETNKPAVATSVSKTEKRQQQQKQQSPFQQTDVHTGAVLKDVKRMEGNSVKETNEPIVAAAVSNTPNCSNNQPPARPAVVPLPSNPNKAVHVTPTIQQQAKDKNKFRYSLDELKLLANSEESQKIPTELFQNGGYARPFVVRPKKQNLQDTTGKRGGRRGGKQNQPFLLATCGPPGPGDKTAGSVTVTSLGRPLQKKTENENENSTNIKSIPMITVKTDTKAQKENARHLETLSTKVPRPGVGSALNINNDEVSKKVGDALTVLTPDNFGVILKTMLPISLDSTEEIQQVTLLIFEKTMSEPNFASTYAKLCKALIQQLKPKSKQLFHMAVIKRFQAEFETNVNSHAKKEKLKQFLDKLEACTDANERLKLQKIVVDHENQFRRRAWGTLGFIGEMYACIMLCIESLLENVSEDKLLYVCELLTALGPLLDAKASEQGDAKRMDRIFHRIDNLIRGTRESRTDVSKQSNISSHVCSMLQDVLVLRRRQWGLLQNATAPPSVEPKKLDVGEDSVTGRPLQKIPDNIPINENDCQPETLRSKASGPADGTTLSDNIDEISMKVRAALAILMPNNFEGPLNTILSISLESTEQIQHMALLVFEKSISEPMLSPTYARLCTALSQYLNPKCRIAFTACLTELIEAEFETNVNADANNDKLRPLLDRLEACTDAKERVELQAEIDDHEYEFRRRASGTVRFIGDMYKLQSLTGSRVVAYIESLLDHGTEEKLEYMCELLKVVTLGDLLVAKPIEQSMDRIFHRIGDIIKRTGKDGHKQPKLSSRMCSMLQDVVDLRGCPRRVLKNDTAPGGMPSSGMWPQSCGPQTLGQQQYPVIPGGMASPIMWRPLFPQNQGQLQNAPTPRFGGMSSSSIYMWSQPRGTQAWGQLQNSPAPRFVGIPSSGNGSLYTCQQSVRREGSPLRKTPSPIFGDMP